jgi:hypothetical protein
MASQSGDSPLHFCVLHNAPGCCSTPIIIFLLHCHSHLIMRIIIGLADLLLSHHNASVDITDAVYCCTPPCHIICQSGCDGNRMVELRYIRLVLAVVMRLLKCYCVIMLTLMVLDQLVLLFHSIHSFIHPSSYCIGMM